MSQGKVEYLIEKYQKGKLTSKEAYEELKKRGLVEHQRWEFIPWVIYFLLLLLPTWAEALRLDFLQWFAELQRFYFPMTVICVSITLVIIGTLFIRGITQREALYGVLQKAPVSVEPALRQAIDITDSVYEEALKALN